MLVFVQVYPGEDKSMSTHPVYLISAGELRRTQSAQVLAQTFKLTAEHFMNTHAFLTLHADATTWNLIAF